MTRPQEIVDFWRAAGPASWYAKNAAFDAEIRDGFDADHFAAARGELASWEQDWTGRLALLLLLDQFPRNIYRGSAHAFATDPLARSHARTAIAAGQDREAPIDLRVFFYLPFEHSELLEDQNLCVELCEALDAGKGELSRWAHLHRDIITRFGRFPHRNAVLGRITTKEERSFLDSGGFSG